MKSVGEIITCDGCGILMVRPDVVLMSPEATKHYCEPCWARRQRQAWGRQYEK